MSYDPSEEPKGFIDRAKEKLKLVLSKQKAADLLDHHEYLQSKEDMRLNKAPKHTKLYLAIVHKDSNRSKKRGECGWVLDKKTGEPTWKNSYVMQLYRSKEGEPLPYEHCQAVKKSFRSKYTPHIGKKHQAKLDKRALLATK